MTHDVGLRIKEERMKNWKKLFALLLAVVMLLSLTACGKDAGTDVTGKYLCIAIAEDGVNFAAPENDEQYVELKMGGKGEIYTDLAFELTWKLERENFSGSYKIFGIDAPITGTLKDGVLEIHDDDVVMRYLKEGAEAPDWVKDVVAAPEKGRLAGMYTLYAMEVAGERYDYAALVEMDVMDSSFLRIDYDASTGYTGELSFEGEEPDTFTLEDELGMLNFPSGEQMGFFEEAPGVVGITQAELGGTIFFALDTVERSAAAADPLVDWWNGDWYGWWFMYGCKGKYEDMEFTDGLIADTLVLRAQSALAAQNAALPFYPNGDGTLTVYLNLATYAGAGWVQRACITDPKEQTVPLSASYEFITANIDANGAVTVEYHEAGDAFSGVDHQQLHGFAFDTPYTIRGCLGAYTGLFPGNIGSDFKPYLFLLTENGTLEYVDLFRCARYETYVCGGPVYGISGVRALSAGIEEKADYSYATVYALDSSGVKHDLLETVYLCDGLPHDLEGGFGCDGEDGIWYSLSFDADDGIHA